MDTKKSIIGHHHIIIRMGIAACCEPSGMGGEMLVDLPFLSTRGIKDRYAIWEYGTPFMRTHFLAFKRAVYQAEVMCGPRGCGWVTIQTLSQVLTTQAWAQLDNDRSPICQVLLSDAFKDKNKGHEAHQIDVEKLIIFGLLHCRDMSKPINKAKGFYELL